MVIELKYEEFRNINITFKTDSYSYKHYFQSKCEISMINVHQIAHFIAYQNSIKFDVHTSNDLNEAFIML